MALVWIEIGLPKPSPLPSVMKDVVVSENGLSKKIGGGSFLIRDRVQYLHTMQGTKI